MDAWRGLLVSFTARQIFLNSFETCNFQQNAVSRYQCSGVAPGDNEIVRRSMQLDDPFGQGEPPNGSETGRFVRRENTTLTSFHSNDCLAASETYVSQNGENRAPACT